MPHTKKQYFRDLLDVRRLTVGTRAGLDLPTRLGFLLLVVLVAISAWLNYRHTELVYEDESYVAHLRHVVGEARGVLADLVGAESGVRGYLLTGDLKHLAPYEGATERISAKLDELLVVTADEAERNAQVQLLATRIAVRTRLLDDVVARARGGRLDAGARATATDEGKTSMDDVRALIVQFEAREDALLLAREARVRTSFRAARTTGIVLGIAAGLLVVLVYKLVRGVDRLRSLAAREMADARERFQVTLGSIGDAVLVVNEDGRLAFCNDSGRSLLRIGDAEIGRQVDDIVTAVTISTGESSEFVIHRALAERGVHRSTGEVALRIRDGTQIPVDVTAARILGQDGTMQGAVLVVRDATERLEREREVALSGERFRSLVLATAQVVWTTDASGHVREDSPSWRKLTGQTYEQWQGLGGFDAVHPEDRERVLMAWPAAVAEKSVFELEYRLRNADGTYRWSLARVAPVMDEMGRVREWVGTSRDIHERKEFEAFQQTESRRKDEFIALLAHEIRNPLVPLRNGLEVLKSGAPSEAPRALEMMERQVRHMVRLIDDLLDVSRITQGKLELRHEHLDLRDVLRQSIEAIQPAIQKKQQHLTVSLPASPLLVIGDPERLTQVVMNLLNNAIKYSSENAAIWLTAEREGTRHLISVRDTGQGIPIDLRPRIWDLFRQGGGRVERAEGGLGIGLTLVKRLVEMHDGSVDVYSDGVGTGSEFTVRLPGAARPAASIQDLPPTSAPPRTRSLRILVVDDNEDSAESLSMLLRIGGHTVRTVFRGEDGVVEYARFAPEIVLCDIRMPGVSGYDVARRLRSMPNGAGTFLVALTGFGADADRAATSSAGFDRHLVKPVDPDDLVELLREVALRPPGPV